MNRFRLINLLYCRRERSRVSQGLRHGYSERGMEFILLRCSTIFLRELSYSHIEAVSREYRLMSDKRNDKLTTIGIAKPQSRDMYTMQHPECAQNQSQTASVI